MPDKKVSVSIITTAYNTPAAYLTQYLESVVHQTIEDYEIVIVDDGSSNEDTIRLLKEYKEQYPDLIKLYFSEKNQGISAGRNKAMRMALGEYVTMVDSDDWVEPDFLEKAYGLAKTEDLDLVICDNRYYFEEENRSIPAVEGERDIYYQVTGAMCARLLKRSMLLEHDLFYPEAEEKCIIEDLPFNSFTFAHAQKIGCLPQKMYTIRLHSRSLSHNKDIYTRLTLRTTPFKYIERHLENISLDTRDEKDRAFIGFLTYSMASIACQWCRNSTVGDRHQVAKRAAGLMRKWLPEYVGNVRDFYKQEISMQRMSSLIFCVFVKLHMEYIAVDVMAVLARIFADGRLMRKSK